jgi:uncharacterized Zn-finger protein
MLRISVKCPSCGTRVLKEVSEADLKAGHVVLTCSYCDQQIRLDQTKLTKKTYDMHIIKPGPSLMLLMWYSITILIYFILNVIFHIDMWVALGFSLLYAIIVLSVDFIRLKRLISVRRPHLQGATVKEAVPVHSEHEEYSILSLQKCPYCHKTFQLGEHSLILTSRFRRFLAYFLGNEVLKFCDRVILECPKCRLWRPYYFNIDQIPYVHEMGLTEEMRLIHMQLVQQEQKRLLVNSKSP